jgi:hypothetical protein
MGRGGEIIRNALETRATRGGAPQAGRLNVHLRCDRYAGLRGRSAPSVRPLTGYWVLEKGGNRARGIRESPYHSYSIVKEPTDQDSTRRGGGQLESTIIVRYRHGATARLVPGRPWRADWRTSREIHWQPDRLADHPLLCLPPAAGRLDGCGLRGTGPRWAAQGGQLPSAGWRPRRAARGGPTRALA